jgi:hypothetical protein
MGQLCFDVARGRYYMPDLSSGNVAMLIESGDEWPISGDRIATQGKGGLIRYVDWASMEPDE